MNDKQLLEIKKSLAYPTIKQIIKNGCGKLLGEGSYRSVYELKIDPRYVVKIEKDPQDGNFCNVSEYRNYMDYTYCEMVKKWLAPILTINETGQVMVQRRVKMKWEDYPSHVPEWFTDTHPGNFGFIGNRFVCIDYSTIIHHKIPNSDKIIRYKKVDWTPTEIRKY